MLSSIGTYSPVRVLTIPKEILISAEIIEEGLGLKNTLSIKKKIPVTAHQKSQVGLKKSNYNSQGIKDKKGKEILPETFPVGPTHVDKPEGTKKTLTSVNMNSSTPTSHDAGENIDNYHGASFIDPLLIIRNSIEKAKVYPPLARRKGIEGKVFLRFRIRPDGEVDEVKIVKGSGSEILDTASIETIKKSAPLPYAPGWIELPLVFKLD